MNKAKRSMWGLRRRLLAVLILVGVAFIVGVIGLGVHSDSKKSTLNSIINVTVPTSTRWLAVKVMDDQNMAAPQNVWLVKLKPEQLTPQHLMSSSQDLKLVDCWQLPDTLCVTEEGRVVHRWEFTPTAMKSTEWVESADSDVSVFALDAKRIFVETGKWVGSLHTIETIYSQNRGDSSTEILLADIAQEGCGQGPKLSPDGTHLAALCFQPDWTTPSPVLNQHIIVVGVNELQKRTFSIPANYFPGLTIFTAVPQFPYPDFEWAPDGTEIAFVIASPLREQLSDRGSDWGGVYSITLTDGVLHKWIEISNSDYYLLTWSPDKKFIAYPHLGDGALYVISRDGERQQIGSFDSVDLLSWSPDGAYIVVVGSHASNPQQLWVFSVSDSTWHEVELPGKVTEIAWGRP